MRRPTTKWRCRAGFSLLEMLISAAIVALAAGGIYLAITSGLNLYAKNTSVNTAHSQMLRAVQRIAKDAHSTVTTPQLINANLTANTGVGPAAGVTFQLMWQRPFLIRETTTGNFTKGIAFGASMAVIDTGSPPGPRPSPGQRIILPAREVVAENITAIAPGTNNTAYTNVTMQYPVWKDMYATQTYAHKPALIVDQVAYVVQNDGTLHYYTQQYSGGAFSWLDRGVRARGITSPTPFALTDWSYANQGLRTSATGFNATDLFGIAYQQDTQTYWKLTATTPTWLQVEATSGKRAVTARFTATDRTYSNRGFKAIDMPLTFKVPYRSKLTTF